MCDICGAEINFTVEDLPQWIYPNEVSIEATIFCPIHAEINNFLKSQCPGCVESWSGCSLRRAFSYHEMKLTENDMDIIRKEHRCPKRINGTMFVYNGKMQHISLFEQASLESSEALYDGICHCRKRWDEIIAKEKK